MEPTTTTTTTPSSKATSATKRINVKRGNGLSTRAIGFDPRTLMQVSSLINRIKTRNGKLVSRTAIVRLAVREFSKMVDAADADRIEALRDHVTALVREPL